jgi:hypothetical protein
MSLRKKFKGEKLVFDSMQILSLTTTRKGSYKIAKIHNAPSVVHPSSKCVLGGSTSISICDSIQNDEVAHEANCSLQLRHALHIGPGQMSGDWSLKKSYTFYALQVSGNS